MTASVANAGATSQAGATGVPANPVDALAVKKQARLQQLHETYDLIRAQPFVIAVLLKLNYVPPPPPPVEEVADATAEAAKNAPKGKPAAKGKK